ncbi:MAG: hypothetical protein HY537_11915 [Deltaproteobacteria bacterium]|nr:hypothetical protein [Deltaproteobacteria bacterium]
MNAIAWCAIMGCFLGCTSLLANESTASTLLKCSPTNGKAVSYVIRRIIETEQNGPSEMLELRKEVSGLLTQAHVSIKPLVLYGRSRIYFHDAGKSGFAMIHTDGQKGAIDINLFQTALHELNTNGLLTNYVCREGEEEEAGY